MPKLCKLSVYQHFLIQSRTYRASLIGLGIGFFGLLGEAPLNRSDLGEFDVLYPPLDVPVSLDRIRVPEGILPRTTEALGGKISPEDRAEAWSSPWFEESEPPLDIEVSKRTGSSRQNGLVQKVEKEERGVPKGEPQQGENLEKDDLNDLFGDLLGPGESAPRDLDVQVEIEKKEAPKAPQLGDDSKTGTGGIKKVVAEAKIVEKESKVVQGNRVMDSRYDHPFLESLLSVLSNEPRLKAALIQIRIEQERARQSRGELLPSLDLVGTIESKSERSQSTFRDTTHPSQIGLVMTQPIYKRDNLLNYQAAKVKKEEVVHQSEEQRQAVIEDLCARYLDIHRFRVLADYSRNNAGLSDQHYRSTKIRFEKGELTRTDVHQAVVRHKTALAVREESDSQVEIARRRFEELTREPAPEDVPFFTLDLSPQFMEIIQGPGSTRLRPDLKVLERQVQQERLLGKVARSRHMPQLDLTVEQTRSWLDDAGSTPNPLDETRVALDLQWNLLNGTSSFHEIRERDLRTEQLQLNLLYQKREAERLISEGIYRVGITSRLVANYGEAVDAADLALRGIQEEFLVGTRTSLDAFDAQNELFISQTRWINAKVDHLLAEVALLRASGHLSLEFLSTILKDDEEDDVLP